MDVLGAELARAAGLPFETYAREAVLDPLGMDATGWPASRWGPASAGAAAPLADVLRLAAELQRPTLVAAATMAEATAEQFPGLAGLVPGFGKMDPCDWGLGFELRGHKAPHWTGSRNSASTFGHFGGSGTFLWVDPEAGVACAALADRDFDEWAKAAWPRLADDVLAATAG
jgi:CubicO group peptidase (beta-lactamase class C family)